MLQPFQTYEKAEQYLNNITRFVIRFDKDPDSFIRKQTRFLNLIANPHLGLKVIHIAGTSGKGSTVTILADILLSQKFKVASSVSPHIGDICERFQLNGKSISKEKFLVYFNKIIPAINQMTSEGESPSYFEILTALQFLVAQNEKMEYIITEVGMGGKYDATNIFIPNKLCVINSIGLDHVAILGNTLVEIAGQKAGIIQANNQAIALSQSLEINNVFINQANQMKGDLDFVIPDFCYENVKLYEGKTYFSYIDQNLLDRQIALGMLGKYQAANASLALRASETLSERDNWTIDWGRLQHQLQTTKLIGRFEVVKVEVEATAVAKIPINKKTVEGKFPLAKGVAGDSLTGVTLVSNHIENQNPSDKIFRSAQDDKFLKENQDTTNSSGKTLIFDGAHNPQKMQAFISSLVEYYPNAKFDFLLAFKKGKDVEQMIDEILKHKDKINKIILTKFDGLQDTQLESQSIEEIKTYLTNQAFENYEICKELNLAYQSICQNPQTVGVITGSLYLISAIKSLDQNTNPNLN
jgi:dihydrofolate synthase / folylpolyglutamate synthase